MEEDNRNYYDWLCGFVRSADPPYCKLLKHLHETEFVALLEMDENRIEDGMDLRFRFEEETGHAYIWHYDRSCSILEMMVALAIRCEEHIMDDPSIGNRTGKWLWHMIENMGLSDMCDDDYDPDYVEDVVDRFLGRRYCSNGEGGLFTVENSGYDLRRVDIWYQAMWYLASLM